MYLFIFSDFVVRSLVPVLLSVILIADSVASSIIFIAIWILIGKFEFFYFRHMINDNVNLQEQKNCLTLKYAFSTVFSSSFYVLCSLQLKYLPWIIDWQVFIQREHPIRLALSFICLIIIFGMHMLSTNRFLIVPSIVFTIIWFINCCLTVYLYKTSNTVKNLEDDITSLGMTPSSKQPKQPEQAEVSPAIINAYADRHRCNYNCNG